MGALQLNTPLWVSVGQQGELAEAELKYVGPLSRGSNAVYFGVELKVKLHLIICFVNGEASSLLG